MSATRVPAGPGSVLNVLGIKDTDAMNQLASAIVGLQVMARLHAKVNAVSEAEFAAAIPEVKAKLGEPAAEHMTSPIAWLGEDDYLGGADETLAYLKTTFLLGRGASVPLRATHTNDKPIAGAEEPLYDYDAIVIGGGSGGIAASKAIASYDKTVLCVDFVKPSPAGTKWGLGGTCVNVGCIPKKLFHYTGQMHEIAKDAKALGWKDAALGTHDWETTRTAVNDYIKSLNFGYRGALRDANVVYKPAFGSFVDPHTIELVDRKKKRSTVTARRIVIAVGGRPNQLDIPGGEHAITSDDIFQKKTAPGKTLVVGASYVALECAGFLRSFGYDVSVMVRSILLRGFDQQCSGMVGEGMRREGTTFIPRSVPTRIEKLEDGRLKVFWKDSGASPYWQPGEEEAKEAGAGEAAGAGTGEESSEIFDTVLTATGRTPVTASLNLDKAGVITDKKGKIPVVNEQTNVPHIYAIGDVVAGGWELTPVAIQAGRFLAGRVFGKSTKGMDYDRVPTVVFTPMEYGCSGLSEEKAIEEYGEDDIEVYHTNFTPLEWQIPATREKNTAYVKLVCHISDDMRVLGFHYVGPNAGEIANAYGIALRLGATYSTFSDLVGIHPTCAEEFNRLTVTKRSGGSAEASGC